MSKHSSAHADSILLCEGLMRELESLQPGITRSEAEGACGCLHPPHSRFAYIYHFKKTPKLRIYFRSPTNLMPEKVPSSISIIHRPKITNEWEKRFPAFFYLPDTGVLPFAAKFLIDVAYPLSVPGTLATKADLGLGFEDEYSEGHESFRLHRRKERNRTAVLRKKMRAFADQGKLLCEVCDFDFANVYGPLGKGFAECHHRVPLAELKAEHRIRLSELAIVCANCYRMLHRGPLHTVEELRQIVQKRWSK